MSTGVPLYELGAALTAAFAEIDAQLAVNDGEFTPEMQARLDAAEGAFEDKAIRVALYTRDLLADVKRIKSERKRLAARGVASAKYAAWLKRYLAEQLTAQGRSAVRGALGSVSVYDGRPSVSTTADLESIDSRWVRVKTERSLDKAAILAAKEAGEKLPPEIKVERGKVVRIS